MTNDRYPVKQSQPLDDEIAEAWTREIADPKKREIHGVEATKLRANTPWRWRVSVWAMEFVRDAPLEAKLRGEIASALRAVPGVAEALEDDREVWVVRGEPSGAALVGAVATAIDTNAVAIASDIEQL